MDRKMDITELKQLVDQNELSRSLDILNERILSDSNDAQAFQLRGRIHYKMQNWGEAMNDFSVVLELEPDNPEAKSGFEMAQNILGYFTPDMFNP
jgi:regulator of sirC expression with transglutaminase-like and TPR domain